MKWCLYSHRDGWFVDDCVGLEWSWDVDDARWFDGENEIDEMLEASENDREPWFFNIRIK